MLWNTLGFHEAACLTHEGIIECFFLVDNYVWFQGKLEGKQVYCMAKLMVSFIYGDIIHNIYIYL